MTPPKYLFLKYPSTLKKIKLNLKSFGWIFSFSGFLRVSISGNGNGKQARLILVTSVHVELVFGQQIDVVKNETIPLIDFERLEKAGVHGDAFVEGQVGDGLDYEHAVVDRLFGEERMNVAEKELEIAETISIGHDNGDLGDATPTTSTTRDVLGLVREAATLK